MADEPWLLKEDGYLNVDSTVKQIVYHPSLNVILICTDLEIVHVLDVNSGVLLQSSRLSAQEDSKVTCRYLTGQDRVLFCDGFGIGVRSDYNGVLLLDTILQKPVASPRDVIKLELLLSEAVLLKQNLILMSQFVIDQQSEVITELCEKITKAQKLTKKGIKAQKWNTVCLELPLDVLKRVAEITVTEFTLKNQHVPELAVAAAVQERLNELLNDPPPANDRSAMASEARRRETFSRWPHMDYKWALPDQMAQAGFYHQPNSSGDDRAMCFTCTVCLVCWERTDEPWSEHERHSPNCPFVMGEYTQNVPLSVTYATAPALDATYRGSPVSIVGTSGVNHLITTANADGLVTVYDISGKLKRTHSFYVTQYDSPILECCMQEFGHNYSWSNLEDGRSISITTLSVVGDKKSNQMNSQQSGKGKDTTIKDSQEVVPIYVNIEELRKASELKQKSDAIRPVVVCGLTIKGRLISADSQQMIIEDAANFTDSSTCLCLVVYDFQYTKDVERDADIKPNKASGAYDVDYNLMDASNNSDVMTFINDMNYQALKLLKQTESNNYQNLIPGESDDIFLPPPPPPPPSNTMATASASGTRLLVVDEEETDASAPNYQLMNGQLSSPSTEASSNPIEKSISDHITELKSSKNKRLNYSHAVQCVALPALYKNHRNLEIMEIVPTKDGGHVLVVLRSLNNGPVNVLLVYALCFSASVVKLVDEPLLVRELPSGQCPLEVSVIPSTKTVNSETTTETVQAALDGSAVIVCTDGYVRIFDLATLKPTCVAKLESEKLVSAAYCNSLERLCAASENGSLHFYAINEVDTDFTDEPEHEHEDEDYLSSMSSSSEIPTTSAKVELLPDAAATQCFQETSSNSAGGGGAALVGLTELRHMHSLCTFEPLSSAYCVVVPPCWSEMQQAQRQRRHPQYLSGDDHHTRTWRLQTDTTTWDEHIFELTLPWPVSIGHVDVHFSLHGQHPNANPPHVEITLLQQKTTGIGHRRTEVHFQVDEAVSFECLQRNQNPVTSREYLRSHNADILAGPINLADCLDLSEQNGCVTLTSPKLFKTNTRTLLLHIKALCDPSKEHTNIRKEFKRNNREQNITTSSASTNNNNSTASASANVTNVTNKAEYYMGCDCLHELSITIYKAKNTDIPTEKIQRGAMLESGGFLGTLLRTAMDCSSVQRQSIAFDVMLWVASIRMARNRASNGEAPFQQVECLKTIESGLETLFKQCLLNSGRNIAHKCVKLIVICSDGARNINDSIGNHFDNKVLQSLLLCLPDVCKVWSAGALHWLVVLVQRVTRETNQHLVANQCTSLLRQISHELHMRTNPYHLLLRSHFGLFGTPLEPELFDVEPPVPAKATSIPITYASVVTGDQIQPSPFQAHFVFNSSSIDPKEVFTTPSSDAKWRLKGIAPNKHMRGLLETEPLHFACVTASDGTRVERFDPTAPPLNMSGLFGPVTVQASSQNQQNNTGTKKAADSDDSKDNIHIFQLKDKENMELGTIIQLDPNKFAVTYPKEITHLVLNADIEKANDWPVLDTFDMTIDDSDLCSTSEPTNNTGNNVEGIKGQTQTPTPTWTTSNNHMDLLSPQHAQCSLQQLLIAPPQQVMVVERMQSGARRFVTLDFGAPVLLTDVIIPACHDLVSLSLDLWLRGEDIDAVRLVLATDIGTKTLVLSDLQPPPICRYIKITTIGRYGMSTTRCRIPIGNFYGHIIILPDEIPPDGDPLTTPCLSSADIDNQMNLLAMLLEDVSCRYSLACSRLKDLLHPLLTADIPNSVHMAAYMSIVRETMEHAITTSDNVKVFTAYQEAMMYQRQLNVVQGVIRRIENTIEMPTTNNNSKGLTESCTDKLRVVAENLLDVLLSLSNDMSNAIDRQTCQQLFEGLCVAQAPRLQMLTATLLVRTCGKQAYWGEFIADTLAQMFASSYTTLFPQDRVFVLLAYLGKKSTERSVVLDATLRILAEVLTSLNRAPGTLLGVSTDLSLLGWILLYLSLQLDNTNKCDNHSARRWNWVTGDNSARSPDSGVCTGSHRRKVHRRFFHYKQQIDQLDWTKKAVQASTQVQALSALSSQAASLTSKLEAALKHQEHVFKRIKQISRSQKEMSSKQETKNVRASSSRDDSSNPGVALAHAQILDADHCLAVTRGLVTLLLAMDHSCSADMFLLACKVIARLVTMARLSICQLFSVDQLQQLMRQCVRGDQPWTQHALACLLQDMLEVTTGQQQQPSTSSSTTTVEDPYEASSVSVNMDTDSQPAGPSWGQTDTEMFENFTTYPIEENLIPITEKIDKIQCQVKSLINNNNNNGGNNNNNGNNPLPSVFESDDSDYDDFLDDILERGRSLLRRNGATKTTAASGSISCAMDARLELGVETTAEIQLRRLTGLSTCNLYQQCNSTPASETCSPQTASAWPEHLVSPWLPPGHAASAISNADMLSTCFNALFNEMQLQSSTNIEHTVRLWLTLNKTSVKGCFHASNVPLICISAQSVNSLVSALVYTPNLSLRTWCVALQALTLICNMANSSPGPAHLDWLEHSLNGMAGSLIAHQDFLPMLLRLLSGSGLVSSDKGLAGPSVCRALHDLLIRLLMRCDVITYGSSSGTNLKGLLLRALYQLVQPSGPLATRQGPLDVQCKFLQSLLLLDYADVNLSVVMCILESTGVLVNAYVSNIDKIKCVSLGERNSGSSNNFGGLFASVLGSDNSKQDRPASWESLLIALLKLLTRLIQTPLPIDRNSQPPQEAMDTETVETDETDESKAERQQEANTHTHTHNRLPCLADTVLQHHPSIIRLCHTLAACSGSSLAMLVGCAQQIGLTDLGEPTTVGDAVFQLLSVMTHKTSKPELILEPLVMFLRSATQLSEPLLWFVLQVLNTEEALKQFLLLDGVRVLAESMVRSGRSLSAVHHGTVSLVMHHMAAAIASSSTSRSESVISGAPSFSKKIQQANLENAEALVNFAPLGSIRCHSGTAQPADVLIQSAVASHRRARTPQWCYHFYPDETHTDLTIRLPCAVLLREVQLQPHLSSLSTCPSAVALEISNGNPDHLVPASPPLATSGMTFIRLHLPVPEVVTHVLLRLYKPRDASNIGLSQIRLLGTSAFGGIFKSPSNQTDVCTSTSDEETFSKFSLGWLRLLHHCFTLPQPNSDLDKSVVAAAANVPDLLMTCCGLLLVPTHIPTLYLPNLERVLCKLSLFDRPSGLNAIRLLLDSKAALAGATHVLSSAAAATTVKTQLTNLNSPATQSVCELLHQVCGHQDQDTCHRVSAVLEWLARTATRSISLNGNCDSCSPAFISCIASVLWSANEAGVSYTLHAMATADLFSTVFKWCHVASSNVALKNALDCLLCSLCYIKTELFPVLLQRMGVLVPNLSTDLTASISDDRKDSESMTDDNKQTFENETECEWYGRLIICELSQLQLTEAQLGTIAMVSRSPPAIQQLLDSGLPKLLVQAIIEFCLSKCSTIPMARLENVTAILQFFADVCAEQTMRDWLGSADGSLFWLPFLQWLCNKQPKVVSKLRSEAHARLEEMTVRFLSKCCLCHHANQKLLAKVLCDVISQQSSGISGFMRRLILQLLLENEKVYVCIKADESIYKISPVPQPSAPLHPLHKRTHDRVLLQLSTNTTIGDILEHHIAFATTLKVDPKPKDNFAAALAAGALVASKEVWEIGIDGSDHISMAAAAGVTAKDKRVKDIKNQSVADTKTPYLKKKRYNGNGNGNETMAGGIMDFVGGRTIRCESLPEYSLPLGLTLGQLLSMLETHANTLDIHLTISHSKERDRSDAKNTNSLLAHRSIGNSLQVFSTMGGLALLAQHLPTVYPEIVRPPGSTEKSINCEQPDTDWVKVEGSDDIYEDLEDIPGSSSPSKNVHVVTNVPPHSLTAFGLFLRLPGYAEVLLKDSKKALCLLRLVLGVTDDGEGCDIFMSPVAESLPTLPFEVLRQLYDTTPLGTDDGRVLRTISINIGVTQLLLGCLAVFTHQIQTQPVTTNTNTNTTLNLTSSATTSVIPDTSREGSTARSEDKSQLYWAKGTGFGTGSTQQSWNVEQALLRQRSEEEHVTVLLQVLASYINPGGGKAMDESTDNNNVLPAAFEQFLANSCLLPALSSYLRNDSVLDMARHIPLYRSVLQLLRAMALSQQLVTLLLPRFGDSSRPPSPSIVSLLLKMKTCVDNYTCRLRFNKNSTNKFKFAKYSTEQSEEAETDEGLALLMPDIQDTANLVQQATNQILGTDENEMTNRDVSTVERPLQQSLEQRYLDIMRRLQFDTFEMITESSDGYKFVVSYHFEGNVRSAGEQSQPARVKRLAQEAVTLATSLPLSYSSSVFVRCDTDRLDIMKVLITGPSDTPYANGCFELDVYFPPDYPNVPMLINLETTGHHTVRFNPNLYNDGKVCLSVLNTWHGRPEEKWNAQTSSFLQVLVSIQSLILVPEPYFNEPGYERSRGTPSGTQSSREYNTNICQATVRWAMLEQIMNPCPCFKDVIHTHFWLKRHEILAQVDAWIADMEAQLAEKRSGRTLHKRATLTNLETFRKNYHQLRDQLAKLTPPDGLSLDTTPAAAAAADDDNNITTTTTTTTTTEQKQGETIVNNDIDTDIEMEKLVSEVCE